MCTLTTFNKAEEKINQANSLQELKQVGLWLKEHFENNPEDRELIRDELAILYSRKQKHLTPTTATTSTRQARLYLKQWAARQITQTPRELQVEVLKETAKAYLVKGHALATPTDTCRHCGRHLTHPVSVLYGIGPECGKHYHIPKSEEDVERIRQMLEAIEYEGWIPKSGVEVFEESS